MSSFEVLYGKKCSVPISWDNPMDMITLGPKLMKEMEQAMIKTRHNLRDAQERQNNYADSKRTHKEFKVGDHVYLQVKPKRSSLRMKACAKLET